MGQPNTVTTVTGGISTCQEMGMCSRPEVPPGTTEPVLFYVFTSNLTTTKTIHSTMLVHKHSSAPLTQTIHPNANTGTIQAP